MMLLCPDCRSPHHPLQVFPLHPAGVELPSIQGSRVALFTITSAVVVECFSCGYWTVMSQPERAPRRTSDTARV